MNDTNKFNTHAIQLVDVKVLKLKIELNSKSIDNKMDSSVLDASDFGFYHASTEYNEESKQFAVKVAAIINDDESTEERCSLTDNRFELEVELVGLFEVDEERFPSKFINRFASENAPLLIYPYLREHVYSLTLRAGLTPTMLPLFEVPVFIKNES